MTWLGVDGGGTKTEALVVKEDQVLGFSRGGPSNHQIVGLDAAVGEVTRVVHEALLQAGIDSSAMDNVVMGLAGADFPEDVDALSAAFAQQWPDQPFQLVNDAEIALDAGTDRGYGISAVAGTGSNVFGRSPAGVKRQVGGLGYEWGDYGSGIDIAREVLHAAFRSAEGRGKKTQLEMLVLQVLGMSHYGELSRALYFQELPQTHFFIVVPLCFQAAQNGDEVAQSILRHSGRAIGESVVGCARLLSMDTIAMDVVMAGSLWLGTAPQLKEAFLEVVGAELPRATPFVTTLRPVAGAVLMAAGRQSSQALRTMLTHDLRFNGVE